MDDQQTIPTELPTQLEEVSLFASDAQPEVEPSHKTADQPAAAPFEIPGTPPQTREAALINPRADIAALDTLEQHLYAHRYAQTSIECFSGSIDPEASQADSGEAAAILAQESQELLCASTTGALLERLSTPEAQSIMDETHRAQVRVLKRDRAQLLDVPAEVQADFSRLTSEAQAVWRKAKQADDWASFEPYLDRIVESMRTLAEYKKPGIDPYDVWLDEFEIGRDSAFYDTFFTEVKDAVVPLLADVQSARSKPSRVSLAGRFEVRRQWELADDLLDLEGLPREVRFVTSTEHPYSGSLTSNYAIVAGHAYEDDVLSNVYSILHEGGHALYETGVRAAYNYTSLAGGTTSGMHEAQSRFFENCVGRDEFFVPALLELLRTHFPSTFNRVTARQLYAVVNTVEPQPIRTEADELTYPLHVLVRYEIERLLLQGEAQASDIPQLWAEKYKSYLGIDVPNTKLGALQDMHWSGGLFGYFPTYALGNAYAAQLRHAMIAEGLDWEAILSSGNLEPIRTWLGENVWQFGRSKDPADIMYDACGEAFNPHYYTTYLQNKFSALYGV